LRFFAVEHITGMIVAIVFGTLGYSLSKRASTDAARFRAQALLFSLALLLILALIPWPFRAGFEAYGWF
jgi:membrane protein DedA with SNARE-associated domain